MNGHRVQMAAVKKVFQEHFQPNAAADKRRRLPHARGCCGRRTLTSRNSWHSTRAPLVGRHGILVFQRSVLPGVNGGTHQTISGYVQQVSRLCHKNTIRVVFTCSQFNNTIGGLMSVVSTWRMIRCPSSSRRLAHRRVRAKTCWETRTGST